MKISDKLAKLNIVELLSIDTASGKFLGVKFVQVRQFLISVGIIAF